jgi:hypothetical protein
MPLSFRVFGEPELAIKISLYATRGKNGKNGENGKASKSIKSNENSLNNI